MAKSSESDQPIVNTSRLNKSKQVDYQRRGREWEAVEGKAVGGKKIVDFSETPYFSVDR